jgi:signal transduction histidine kinase
MTPTPRFYDHPATPTDLDVLGRQEEHADSVDYSDAAFDRRVPSLKQAQQAQRLESLGQLAGGIAHDFNNLLAVILGYTSFVVDDLRSSAGRDWSQHLDAACNDLGQVTLAGERAARLTHQLLAFARQEVIRPQVLDLNHVISGVEQMLRPTIGEHVGLVLSLEPDLWPVLADPSQLEQVLVKLAVNARDAMPGGGTLTIQTRNIDTDAGPSSDKLEEQPQRSVQLKVSDTGTGMTAEVVAHAFEPFFSTKKISELGSAWQPCTDRRGSRWRHPNPLQTWLRSDLYHRLTRNLGDGSVGGRTRFCPTHA